MKMLLLALMGIVFLIGGVGLGLLLQNWQKSAASSAGQKQATADSSSLEGESPELVELPLDEPEAPPLAQDTDASSRPSENGSMGNSDEATAHTPPLASTILHAVPGPYPDLPSGAPAEQLVQADKLLMVGNYRHAHEEYLAITVRAPSFQQAEVRLRLALCEEALGDHKQAQGNYRKVVELLPALELREAAILGQARLWCLAGRNELATATLFRAVLTSAPQATHLSGSQIPHELAVLLSQRVRAAGKETDHLDQDYMDEVLLTPVLKVEPFQVIATLTTKTLTVPQDPLIPVNDVSVVERFSPSPEETFVNVRTERTTVLEVIRRVANRAGWNVRLTEETRLRLQEHTIQPDCRNLPLAMTLDAILEPFETMWRIENNALLIFLSKHASVEEIETYRIHSAQRALRFACKSAPEHPWAAASSLELARLTAFSGALETAAGYLSRMLEQFPRSEFQPIGWFNLGKLELRQGHLDAALHAFHRAADLLVGHPRESLSYLYAGRVQIENDLPRESIPDLTRALVLAEGSKMEPMAALQLASAYLMLEHFQRANEILMEHRNSFNGTQQQDQAAFLSSLIQYRATKDKQEQFRAGTSLLGSLTNLHPDQCFGGHWQWLAGTIYREFGMSQQEIAVLRSNLNNPYAYPLQNRVRLLLLEDAPDQLVDFQPQMVVAPTRGKPTALYFQTQLKEASTSLQRGNPEAALQLARHLAEHPHISDEDRRAALRLMGRIYQSRGEHELAVKCFSGIIPNQNDTHIPPTAALPFPAQGVR